jgi:hypothetical protein
MPVWLSQAGVALGIFLIGLAVGLFAGGQEKVERVSQDQLKFRGTTPDASLCHRDLDLLFSSFS